jgi:DNA-directed RNA polymerase subunit E'/Rpb7
MDNIYFNSLLTKKIHIESRYLDENIDNYIEKYLKNKVEGSCIDEGYVEHDTVKIITKSVGSLLGSRFTGDVTYNIAYSANICNPVIGNVIDCKVKFINKVGILGNNGPLTILVPRQIQDENDNINKINENDIIKVEVIAKKFYLNSKEIKIVGKIWSEDNEGKYKKIIKKNFVSSDLTPINNDDDIENEFLLNDNEEDNKNELSDNDLDDLYNSEEDDEEDNEEDDAEDDAEEENDVEDTEEENKNLHNIENPDENNLEDIEIDDDYEDDDIESHEDF